MKPKQMFQIKNGISPHLLIEEQKLMPESHFTPEDKKAIAAIHAQHIEDYFMNGMSPPPNILLVNGQKLTNLPGTVRQLTTPFETVNGHNVDIQTIFAPVDDYPRGQNAQSCRYLKLAGQTYA